MTIEIAEPRLIEQLQRIAQREQRDPLDVIAEAVDLYEATQEQISQQDFLAAITGLGVADVTDLSERDEEILAAEISPIRGWGLPRDEHSS